MISRTASQRKPERQHFYRRAVVDTETGAVAMGMSGRMQEILARCFAPPAAEVRATLLRLRTEWHLSRPALAALLGTSVATVRAWESGWRSPSGSAKRLIWYLEASMRGDGAMDLWRFLTWGRVKSPDQQEANWVPFDEVLAVLKSEAAARQSSQPATGTSDHPGG